MGSDRDLLPVAQFPEVTPPNSVYTHRRPALLRHRLPWSAEEQDVAVRVANLEAA
jgi:hypothetical protein